MIPITRLSRLASTTSASPKTGVYAGGGFGASGSAGRAPSLISPRVSGGFAAGFLGAGLPSTIEPGFAACHFSIPSRPPSSAGAKPLPLTVWMWTTTGRSASNAASRWLRSALTSWPSITPM